MNNFISSLYVWIDIVKAIGPIIIGIFGVWIAYGQFKLSKSQSRISQEQLALAKQQADIAQKKVEQDIRDKKYEVFKRWNEAFYSIVDEVEYMGLSKYRNSFFVFKCVSDELTFIFNGDQDCYQKITSIVQRGTNIYKLKQEFSPMLEDTPIEFLCEKYVDNYEDQIRELTDKMLQDKKILFKKAYKEL